MTRDASYNKEDNPSIANKELAPLITKNKNIIDKNNQRNKKDLINSIRRFDDRTISYNKAKNHLWSMTKNYLYQHFEKQDNSRQLVFPQYNKKGECINRDSLLDISFHSVFSR